MILKAIVPSTRFTPLADPGAFGAKVSVLSGVGSGFESVNSFTDDPGTTPWDWAMEREQHSSGPEFLGSSWVS
jgi:hypothetical protein